jgi:hypothetical protein
VPDDDLTRPEALHQQPLDELRGAHALHLPVEAQYHDPVHAVRRQCIDFFAQPHQARRRRSTLEELARSRLESDDGAWQAQPLRVFADRGEHALVAAMYAVVIADRDHAAAVPLSQVVQAAHDLH